ncbi:MAG: amidohydrolase [Flavobacteriales bacterium]|nr:amidohydrolase [Flavobacteriales bacterium]MCB9336007.1 amidohydrolase [Flavobacteriales bacterium]
MNLKVTIIQSQLFWEDIDKNLEMFSQKLEQIQEATDLVVLPEMFSTGFSMNSEKLAESMEGKAVKWMKENAKGKNFVVTGSLIIKEEGKYYNRLIWAQPDGKIQTYDKRHLFRMANENHFFSSGKQKLIVELKGWKICPLICYDLRFPVWSRNQNQQYDCLIYVANWPEARKAPWTKLLQARAIENQVYVIGVNRVGQDGKEINYSGNSAIIDPKGDDISQITEHMESIQTFELDKQDLEDFREKFPVAMDADDFEIK